MPSATKKVSLVRRSQGRYTATNARGGQIQLGSGQDAEFTPVELLLAAIGGCSSIDVDTVTSRRGEPTQFTVSVSGTKRSDDEGRVSLGDVAVDFQLRFPDTEEGRASQSGCHDVARQKLHRLADRRGPDSGDLQHRR